MVRQPNATMQLATQDIQLVSKHSVLSFKPQLRLEWRAQGGQDETEYPDHSSSLDDSVASSTRIRFSVHTGGVRRQDKLRVVDDVVDIFVVADEADPAVLPFQPHQIAWL